MMPNSSSNRFNGDSLVDRAAAFAAEAHEGQYRKYTAEPYIVHPRTVAATVSTVTNDPVVIAAAWLHDVAEDTPVTIEQIAAEFGVDCAAIVSSVTNRSKPTDGNRAARKAIDRQHLAQASPEGKTVKLADLLDNVSNIIERDHKFAKVYLREKRALLPLLEGGNPALFAKAEQVLKDAERALAFSGVNRRANNRRLRSQIGRETVEITQRGWYEMSAGERIEIAEQVADCLTATKCYTPQELEIFATTAMSAEQETAFEVTNETSLSAAHRLVAERKLDKTLCLNFASAKNPGGGFLGGSQAQEESLARSSALYATLVTQDRYYEANRNCGTPLYTDHIILSPHVPVFRDDDGSLLAKPYLLSILTAPAVNAGAVRRNRPAHEPLIRLVMEKRIAKVLAVAAHHGYRHLILGAWGCGVFRNDPQEVASLFRDALNDEARFRNRFETIVFAVLDRTADKRVVTPFLIAFGS